MTVQELINQLQQFNPQTEVLIECFDPTDYRYTLEPISIELGVSEFSKINDDENDEWDEEGNFTGEKVLLINVGVV